MDYTEFAVPMSLQRYVQCVWRLRDYAASAPAQTIYPDGRCELIVHLGAPMRRYTLGDGWQTQAPCLFAAQIRSAIRLASTGPVDCIGVRLQPAVSHAIAARRLAALIDQIVDLHTLDRGFAPGLYAACRAYAQACELAPLWQLLEVRLSSVVVDAGIEAAVAALDRAGGDIAIIELARRQHMSLRSLQTRFVDSVGLTAKEYARVRRLAATIRALDRDAEPLSALAINIGFADQAHATRELQHLIGLTPARLRQALQAEREGDATLRMAAAFVRGFGRG